jgi:hypothetical protein
MQHLTDGLAANQHPDHPTTSLCACCSAAPSQPQRPPSNQTLAVQLVDMKHVYVLPAALQCGAVQDSSDDHKFATQVLNGQWPVFWEVRVFVVEEFEPRSPTIPVHDEWHGPAQEQYVFP